MPSVSAVWSCPTAPESAHRLPVQLRLRQQLYKAIRQGLLNLGARKTAERLRQRYSRRYASADYQAASPVMRQTLVNVVNQDLLDKARQVAVPTVLVWGDEDEDTPLWMGQKLEQTIPDAALIVFEGAGHYAYLDYPQKTASIMHALFKLIAPTRKHRHPKTLPATAHLPIMKLQAQRNAPCGMVC